MHKTSLLREIRPSAILTVFNDEYGSIVPYIETREIGKDGVFSSGKPVSLSFLSNLADLFGTHHKKIPYGKIPKNLLFADIRTETYVWYNSPRKRMMYFCDMLNLEDREYNMPGFIYKVKGKCLEVYSFKGKVPSLKSKLLYAPAFNTSYGKVCLGNAKNEVPDEMTWENYLLSWENIFWNSKNSHLGVNPTNGNLNLLIKEAADEPFDISTLKDSKMTLQTLLKK